MDLRKVFDTVDHGVLLQKIKSYGIDGLAHKWLTSYLQERTKVVEFKGAKSSRIGLDIGVPQGSILGPLLFILFINDLSACMNHTNIDIFADDTIMYIACKTVHELESKLNADLANQIIKRASNINETHYPSRHYGA